MASVDAKGAIPPPRGINATRPPPLHILCAFLRMSPFMCSWDNEPNDPNVDLARVTDVYVVESALDNEDLEECFMLLVDDLWFNHLDAGQEPIEILFPLVLMSTKMP